MVFFLIGLILAALGVGLYATYNAGAHYDVSLLGFKFAGVPGWEPMTVVAGAVLVVFLVYTIYATIRISLLKRSNARIRRDLDAVETDGKPALASSGTPLQSSR